MIEPLSSYYFDGKVFKLRSKWPKRVRMFISTCFVLFSLLFVQDAHLEESEPYDVPVKSVLEDYVLGVNPKLKVPEAKSIIHAVTKWGEEFNIDPKLLLAIAKVESTFDKYAISPSGAYGLMQVIPVWHKDKIQKARDVLGNPEIFNISTNVYLGALVLRNCFALTGKANLSKALLCYAGQTPGYDAKVLGVYRALKIFT